MTAKHRISPILPVSIVLLLSMASLLFIKCALGNYGHLTIRVLDAYSLSPICGAYVTVADIDKTIQSDSSGIAFFGGIPLRKNPLQERILPQNWGECTIIASCSGYRPTIMLNTHIYENKVRSGPVIYMFPEESDDAEIISVVESPDRDWMEMLIAKYRG